MHDIAQAHCYCILAAVIRERGEGGGSDEMRGRVRGEWDGWELRTWIKWGSIR
jgi:hypothetical protein